LGNEEKRKIYDNYGQEGVDASDQGGHPGFEGDLGDVFGSMFGFAKQSNKGRDIQETVTLTFRESVNGCEKEVSYTAAIKCTTCEGTGAKPGTKPATCKVCSGKGQTFVTSGAFKIVTPCESCHGEGQINPHPCSACRGTGSQTKRQTVKISIPAGVGNDMSIRSPGKGNASDSPKGQPGDLYLKVKVLDDPVFDRVGNDIHVWVPLTLSQALLGTSVKIPTPFGPEVDITVPPAIQNGEKRVIRGKGMPPVNQEGRGDLIVHFEIKVPTNLTPAQKQLIEEFKKEEKSAPSPSARSLSGEKLSEKSSDQQKQRSRSRDPHEGFFTKFFSF